MSKSKLLSVALVAVAVIGAPLASALSFDHVALGLVALPGAVAAALLLDVRTRVRTRHRRAEAMNRALDRRLDEIEAALGRLPSRDQVATPSHVRSAAARVEAQVATSASQTVQALERPPARTGVPTHEDLIGTVRLIQAQYEGRLDRAQRSLDDAVRALHRPDAPSPRPE